MNILGINDGHQSSAAMIVDGHVLAAIAEERFTRRKNEHGYPVNAIRECLKIVGLESEDIDHVAIATRNLPPSYFMIRRDSDFSISDFWKEQTEYWYPKIYKNKNISYLDIFKDKNYPENFLYDSHFIKSQSDTDGMRLARQDYVSKQLNIEKKKITFYDHHECHAYYGVMAADTSSEPRLVFTADGFGDGANASIWVSNQGKALEKILHTHKCHIGRMYRYATLLLGMKPAEHEYKVMGLAPYANPDYSEQAYNIYAETLQVNGIDFCYNKEPKDNFFYFKEKLAGQRFDSIAYGIQKRCEELITEWIGNGVRELGISNVIFSGGVAQNIKANKKVWEMDSVNDFFVPAGAHDESLSLGAAYLAHINSLGIKSNFFFPGPYLGTQYSSKDLENVIKNYKNKKNFVISKASTKDIARLLVEGEVIGWMNGRMEFGARALGCRSIIAHAGNPEVIKKINDQVKKRDFWMPFAPSIKSDREKDYIINPKKLDSRLMTIGFDSTELARKEIPAALHPYDYTVRPNVIYKKDNEKYYSLLEEFEKLTGIGAILNTSFNLHGEPVVESPIHAISTFERCGLKYLYVCGWLIKKVNAV